jgi:hypothetical protein
MAKATIDKPRIIKLTEFTSVRFLSPQEAIYDSLRGIDWSPLLFRGELNIYVKDGKATIIGIWPTASLI